MPDASHGDELKSLRVLKRADEAIHDVAQLTLGMIDEPPEHEPPENDCDVPPWGTLE